MRRSPAYIETPQIRLPPAVNISHQNIRGVHSEHTQNFIYPSLKCKWPIHTKLLAPNDLISLSYRTQYCVWNDNVYYELKKKIDWNILVLPDQCSRTFWASSRYRYRDTIMACCLPAPRNCLNQIWRIANHDIKKYIWNYCLWNVGHFCPSFSVLNQPHGTWYYNGVLWSLC